jgi:hypothetical protein
VRGGVAAVRGVLGERELAVRAISARTLRHRGPREDREPVGNDTAFVGNDDLCGGDPANNTYAEVLPAYEYDVIDQVVPVTDSSSGTMTVTLDPRVMLA